MNGSFGNVGRGKEAKSSKILRHRPEVRLVGHDFVSQVVHLGHGFGLEEDGAVLAQLTAGSAEEVVPLAEDDDPVSEKVFHEPNGSEKGIR